MVTCEIDSEVSGEVLGWPLPPWQALLLHRVLPSCGGLVLYLTVICYDVALVYEHYHNGDDVIAAFSILLMILPAVVSLVFTLASPPPGLHLQTELALTSSPTKEDCAWVGMQIVNFAFFPVAAIGRYCHQIFWWVEAVCASRALDDDRTLGALAEARGPSPLELYLFLQAFLHSAPHAVLNIVDMLSRNYDPDFDKVSVQAVSIVASFLRMASAATVYRRFEREKLCGKHYPWFSNFDEEDTQIENVKKDMKEEDINKEPIYETITKQNINIKGIDEVDDVDDLIQFSPNSKENNWFDDNYSDSGTSSDFIPPTTNSRRSSAKNSDDEYIRPISIIDKVAPRRRETQYVIERVEITPPPAFPAPRPMSLAAWAEKMVENAESIPEWLSAPPRRRHGEEILIEEPDIPRRVPRSFIRGLEPQDATAALVSYLGWYAFFVSRMLSISVFIYGLPVAAIIVLFSHYQVMLLLLIVPQAPTVRRVFYIFLAFVYLFCLMEFNIRFRHVRVWHAFWIIVCALETVIFTGLWSGLNNDVGGWWKMYIVRVIFVSLLLSYMCFLVYFVYLKPRETIVYVNNKNTSVK